MTKIKHGELIDSLIVIIGEEYVLKNPAALEIYSKDMTVEPAHLPDVVAMPKTVEEIQEIMKLANKSKTPVVPFVTGTNLGGLTIPQRGGIVLDLKRMNRIIEVDEENMYAVVEPGVSFGDMEHYLRKNCPSVRISQPAAPAFTSVMANYLLAGLGHLAMKAGCHGDMINGLEAVLPTGELIKTGSICASPYWFGRHPLPDFCGLFINWKGSSGIATKASIQLWPNQAYQDFYAVGVWDVDHFHHVLQRIIKAEITDEQSGRSREIIEVALGMYEAGKPKMPWEMLVMQSITAPTQKLFDAKVETLHQLCDTLTKEGYRAEILEQFSANEMARAVSRFPSTGFVVSWIDYGKKGVKRPGGGASWVGAYIPLTEYSKVFKEARAIMERHDYAPMITSRTMGLGRYTICRFLVPYRRDDAQEVADVRSMLKELAEAEIKGGALMYKAPPWAAEMMLANADPGYLELLKKLKALLDPNDIMNPGMLGL